MLENGKGVRAYERERERERERETVQLCIGMSTQGNHITISNKNIQIKIQCLAVIHYLQVNFHCYYKYLLPQMKFHGF